MKEVIPFGKAHGDARISTQVLTLGGDHIVSYAGTSQFTAQGVSACGLAAFNFARVGFRIEQSKKNLADVLDTLSTREVIEEVVAICAGWSSDLHLEVEEIHKIPIFGRSLRHVATKYSRPLPEQFRNLLEDMKNIEKSAVMIITRPPEIIACFKFANADANPHSGAPGPLFVVFDSHPRPSHPNGAGLSFSTSIESTARILSNILPSLDEGIFDSSDFQWQAQLLENCSAHIFIARHRRKDPNDAIVQSSIAILSLRAQISELNRENETLRSDNKELELDVDRLRAAIRQEQVMAQQFASSSTKAYPRAGRSYGLISHAVAGPSRSSGSARQYGYGTYIPSTESTSSVPVKGPRPARSSPAPDISGAKSIFADNPPPVPSRSPPTYDDFDFEINVYSDDHWIQDVNVARKLQGQFDSENKQYHQDIQNARVAHQLQEKFDSEDKRLRQEQAELARFTQATFKCSICMDELPEDDVTRVDNCTHTMCRACLREFVSVKIQEHRFPIFCPVCTIVSENKAQSGVISRITVEQLGVSEEQLQILTEMELADFTIQIHCRKCRRATFVDREDHSMAFNIVCPQHDCQHIWCKKCEQTIVIDGPKHSCDGSSELDHLMKEKGWKHCPNCATPIQKESGCNHMTCISPGCNTHFCYTCGGLIVRSALNRQIETAVSDHFRKCLLFEVPD